MSVSIVRVDDDEVRFDFSDVDFDQTLPATPTVILSTMCANVAVMGLKGIDQIRIVARGNKATELNIQTSGRETMISSPLEYYQGKTLNHGGNFQVSGVSTVNNVLYINGRAVDSENPMMLLVMVPTGTLVKVGMVIGKKVVVRNVCGALEAKLQGITNVEVDYLTEAEVKLSGTGSFSCGFIEGEKLSVTMSGMGTANVSGGSVANFHASVSGMGSISYMGSASNADLSVSGMGSVTLMTCTRALSKNKSGMGTINVINDQTKKAGSAGFENW